MIILARSDGKKTPDFSNVYIYVNKINRLPLSGSDLPSTFGAIRNHLSIDGRAIIYKKRNTVSKDGVDYSGNVYYLLGKGTFTPKTFEGQVQPQGLLWQRGKPNTGQIEGSAVGMDTVYINTSGFFENPTVKNFSLTSGGIGTNGTWYAYNESKTFSGNEAYPCKPLTNTTYSLSTTHDSDDFWIGLENSIVNHRDKTLQCLSGTYVIGGVNYKTMRHYNWQWSSNPNSNIITWADMQKQAYNTFYLSDDNNASIDDVFDGDPLFLNIYVSEDYDACIEYINKGIIPPDATIINADDAGVPQTSTDDDGNDDSSNPEDKGNPDDNTQGNPNHSIPSPDFTFTVGSVNNYWLSRDELSSFITWFWNESITDSWTDILANTLSGMYGNLTQCITSIKKMPCPVSLYRFDQISTPLIKVGRYQYTKEGATFYMINNGALSSTLVGSIEIKKKYNNFVDFAPYTALQMYLPYVGIIPLDTNLVMGRTIKVYAIASVYTSEIQYTLHASKDDVETLIGVYVGKCGIDVPFSLDDASRIFSNVANNISGAISSLSGINLPDIGGTSAPMNVSMQASNQLSVFTPEKCCLIAKRKRYQLPSNYGSKVGWKCGKKYGLFELVGFTVVENPIIKRWNGTSPTQAEIDEIYALLSSGVVL